MRRLSLRIAGLLGAVAWAGLSAAPALAAAGPPTAGTGRDILPAVLWTLGGVAVFALLLSIFYLLKRRVGGFPANPTWVAPITIMPSSESRQDDDAQGHAEELHAPAGH